MTRVTRLLAFAVLTPVFAVSSVLAGCSGSMQQAAKSSPPKNLADIPVMGLPIEPGAAADLGYSINWVSRFGKPDERIRPLRHVRVLGDLVVFLEEGSDKVTAYDAATGAFRWSRHVGERLQVLYAPVRSDDWVYINTESRLHRINAKTGYEAEPIVLKTPVAAEAAVFENFLVFGGLDGRVVFFNLRTGYATWEYQLPKSICTRPVVFAKSLFAVDSGGNYVMLSPDRRELAWRSHTWGPVTIDPVLFKDTLIVPCMDGTLYGIHRSTGLDLWKYYDMQVQLEGPPFVVESRSQIVLSVRDEGLRILSANSGQEALRIKTTARPVVSADGKMVLLDKGTNEMVLMEVPGGREIARVPSMPLSKVVNMGDGSLLFVGVDGQLMRLTPNKK